MSETPGRANELVNRGAVLSLVSSFTADPLVEPLEYLLREMGVAASVVSAPYGQVFQALLDPSSAARSAGIVVVAIRFADFGEASVVDDLASAIRAAHDASASTFAVCVCPSDGDVALEHQLREQVTSLPRVRFVGTAELLGGQPAASCYDDERNRLGHVPYVPSFFARLALSVARRAYGILVPARKVIAVDGDNTLWRGIIGEDGVEGVILDAGRRAVQEFLVEQQRAGMLLCLVSKNNESDVQELFATRNEMPLRLEHFVATRINWSRKSENLRALANELSLGLDSFIFVDDSPVECNEVQQGCPEVLTIQLPVDARALDVLHNTWAFDRWVVTKEDRERTAMYQQGRARDEVKKSAVSLEAFIAELGVEVGVSPIAETELARGSQLTHRTNQFNFTTIRRTDAELAALAGMADAVVLVAQVRDRFGDYGLTGLVVARASGRALLVDTFLLSCRVLGRGVEQRIVEALARLASERRLETIEMPFIRTRRNAPAELFLARFDSVYRTDTADGFIVRMPASEIATINSLLPSIEAPDETIAARLPVPAAAVVSASAMSARLRELAADPERLLTSIAAARRRSRPADAPPIRAATSETERTLVQLWSELLGVEPAGADDNFLAFGGDSLLGTLLLSRVRTALGASLPIRALFEAPTPALLAEWIATAPAPEHVAHDGTIQPLAPDAALPMSRGQVRLWVMEQLDGATSALNVPTAFALDGAVNVEALRRALVEITHRHKVLRSRFVEHDGRVQLEIGALSSSVMTERTAIDEAEALRILDEDASRPFDVATESPFRALLVHSGTDRHHLVVTMHHIVSDGWSQGVLVRELSALYDAFSREAPSPLAPLAVQYTDVVAWEQARDVARDRSADVAFWKAALGEAPALSVPTDRPRPATATQRGAHVHFSWDADTARMVREVSLRAGVTPFITLLAAWTALLYRHGGQDDLVVGSAVANRQHESAEPLIGFFVNTLALRMRVSPEMSFAEFLAHVRDVALSAQEHALPFDVVVDSVRPPVDASRHPLFQAAFVLQNWAMPALAFPGVAASQVTVETGGSQLDLQLSLGETASGISGTLEYNADLFDPWTATQLTRSLGALLRSALGRPGQPVSSLSVVSAEQEAELIAFGRAGGERSEFLAPLFHEMFEAHARANPEAIALRFDGQSLSYGELNARANRVARALRANGVQVESLVGLCVDRSFELIIGMLGALKAGAAFVPMDPHYPRERLRLMLEDSAAAVVLTTPGSRGVIDLPGVRALDITQAATADVPSEDLSLPLGHGHLAYVIYTSGSTGRPKGTLIEHRGLANFAHYFLEVSGAASAKRVLQFASPSFDASVSEYTLALGHGGTLVLPTREQIQSWPELTQLLHSERITSATLPPALLRASAPESFPDLVTLIAAGEASSRELVDRWAPGRRMLNGYGPTEVTIAASYGLCIPGDSRPPAIGLPVPNSRSYVVDTEGRLVPPGVPGELWVGGVGVARGYLNRPETTAERFVTASFGTGGPERVYRTGDLVRWRDDGNLEFIGRIDDQVKIRGHRVELGEIESALLRAEGVRDAVVIAREDEPGDRRLAAYVIGDATDDAMRAALQRELPEYMVPSAFVRMASFPLSPNGKVDRKALPRPDMSAVARRTSYVAPRTETERTIAEIWSQVLKVPEVGVEDDFFALGGDSILSIQVLSRCVKAGISLTARQLFLTPTIAGLARAIQPEQSSAKPRVMVEEPVPEGDVQLTPIQQWFFALELADQAHWNQAFLFTVPADIDVDRLERALVRVAERHDALRLRFRKTGRTWKQTYGAAANVTLERFDLSGDAPGSHGERISDLSTEVQESLHISRGPLFAAAHFTLGAGQPGRLLIVAHHLVVDGVSWRILLDDLESVYLSLAEQRPIAFASRTTSYQRWAELLVARGTAPVASPALEYWRQLSRACGHALEGTAAESENLESDARVKRVVFSNEETDAIVRALPATGTSVHEALLASLGTALDGNGVDVVVHVEGHGREAMFSDVDVSRTVGWFTSVYPVALPSGRARVSDVLVTVRARLQALPVRGADYLALDLLSTTPEVRGVLDAVPRADLVFNYLGQFDQVVGGLSLFRLASESTGPWHAPAARRPYAHEVGAIVRDGRLELTWTHDPAAHTDEQVNAALMRMRDAMLELVVGVRGDIEDVYPLSPIQAGLLFHALASPDSSAYQIQSTWTLRGPLDRAAYRKTWEALLARHSVLRTEFVWEGVERPLQVVRGHVSLPWRELDLRHLDLTEQHVALDRLRADDRRDRFDLARAPLLRVALVRTADDAHEVVWNFHHVLLDGWSGAVIVQELAALYESLSAGKAPDLPPVRGFGEYVRQLPTSDPRAHEYWSKRLDGISSPSPLGVDRAASGDAADFQEIVHDIDAKTTSSLRQLAREHRVTLNVVAQAAWAIMLRRYSGEADVVFGETVTNRPASLDGVERMVGLFLNTLPVRVHVEPDAPVGTLLRAMQAEQAEKSAFETTPLTDIQRWSGFAAGSPLFESLIVFENYPAAEASPHASGVTVHDVGTEERTHYPLTLTMVPGEVLRIRAMYDESRFDAPSIHRLLGHFSTLFHAMVATPDAPVATLPMLTDTERVQMVERWNATTTSYPRDAFVDELFAAEAAKHPDAVAVVHAGGRTTYAELRALSAAVAAALRAAGVQPGDLVGLCVDRSLGLLAALLGILEAGAAYVPLDPGYPVERHQFLLEDAAVRLVLAQAEHAALVAQAAAGLAVAPAVRVLGLDGVLAPGEGAPATTASPSVTTAGTRAAYVMYTSGSTGRPKGVVVPHRAIVRLVRDTSYATLDADTVMLGLAPSAFDAATFEVWGALLNGGRLVLSPAGPLDLEALGALVAREGVTTLWLTAALFQQVVDGGLRAYANVKELLAGGDVLSVPHVRRLKAALPQCRLINGYGPTENTTFTATFAVPGVWPPDRAVPIGRPISNTRCYVLDGDGQAVPVGVAGELYAGGDGVALGYLARPELTTTRFVPDTFSGDSTARLYRTGDRVRWSPDGTLEFLGRFDNQVKIRGFRVEPGEVETVLSTHPALKECVVIVRRTQAGIVQLVGYYVASADSQGLAAQELQSYLRERLPEYMVPTLLVSLDALPVGATGKVDRARLPEPETIIDQLATFVAPRTSVEETLAAIWCAVLRRPRVGVHDNFFELGGDSILSIQIASRARDAGIPLKVSSLKKHPTIAEQATIAATASSPTPVETRATGSAPLTPIQRWFFALDPAERNHWNQAFVLDAAEHLDTHSLTVAISALADHHDVLRLRFANVKGEWTQQFAPSAGDGLLTEADLREHADARSAFVELAARAQASLDIERGPLVRALLARMPTGDRLLLVIHHLAVDGVSWRILFDDLERAYRSHVATHAIALPPRTSSFKGWAEALVAYANSDAVRSEIGYWEQVTSVPALQLPVDGARDAKNTVAEESSIRRVLSADETRDLLQRAPAAYATQINDLLLAALARALAPWVGTGDLLIDLEGHGREDIGANLDVSRTVGWFTSMFPFRLPLSQQRGIGDGIRMIKERLRAMPRQGIGFDVLRRLSGAVADGPPRELVFNYLGQFGGAPDGALLRVAAPEEAGAWVSSMGRRPNLAAVNALVLDGELHVHVSFGRNVHDAATIERIADAMVEAIREVTRHCLTPGVGGRVPSDYPLAHLSQEEVDRVVGAGMDVDDVLPVAPLQKLFLATGGVATEHGFEQQLFEIDGSLDPAAMRRAWQYVIQRHQILRSDFVSDLVSDPVQVVRRSAEIVVAEHDARSLRATERDVLVQEIASLEQAMGIDASRAPLMRVQLVRTGDAHWTLVWSYHHLLLDRWSLPLLLNEVGVAYRAFALGNAPALAPAPLWGNYVAWLEAQDRMRAEEFWSGALAGSVAGALPVLVGAGGADGEAELFLTEEQTRAIATVARQARTTVNAVVSAAWALWLSHVTNKPDVTFGLAAAVRPDELVGVRHLVGMCLNNVPARLEFAAHESGETLVARMSERLDAATSFAHVALTDIQRWSGRPWHQRVFDTLVVFHHHEDDAVVTSWLGDGFRTPMRASPMQTNFPLTLVVGGGTAMRLRLAYQGRAAGGDSARQVLATVVRILAALSSRSAASVGDLLTSLPPAPIAASAALERDLTPARNDTEWIVAAIWADLLGLGEVGVHENFFALGGQSLVATQILSRVHDALQMTPPISLLFEYPTVAGFSAALTRRESSPGQIERIAAITRRVEKMSVAELREAGVHD